MEKEECGQDAHAPFEEAIRKHLRPELVNRLTKIVHFNPLGMDAAREIVGRRVKQLNVRISGRGVTVELDDSAVDLILREGFSPGYGARNLKRVMDRLLGGPIAEKILDGRMVGDCVIRISAIGAKLEFQ